MKQALIVTVCLTLSQVVWGRDEALANEGKRGLAVRYVDHALRLKPDEVDLGNAALLVSEEWSHLVDRRRYLDRLDKMARDIRAELAGRRMGIDHRAVGVINEYLFGDEKFKPVASASDPNDLFLDTVLDKKRGYCLSLSVLYLSIGERLGLPLYGVVVPGHFFVRYDDGRTRFNIETTNQGRSAPDDYYRKQYGVPNDERTIYLKNLNPLQTLGCFFNNLGNSYVEIGDSEAAMMAFARAVEVTPTLGEARTNLGNLFLRSGRLGEAIEEYNAALHINPKDAKTRNNLGNALGEAGRDDEAVTEYLYALELDSDYIDAYRNLAIAYTRQGKYPQALSQLKRAAAGAPRNAEVQSQMGDVYTRMGDIQTAVARFNTALKLEPNLAEAYFGLAVCYNRLGRTEDEIAAYSKALSLDPQMAAAWANLGNVYFTRQRYEAAAEHYRRAAALRPDDASIHYNLGSACLRQEDFGSAAKAYARAVELQPELGDGHYGLAYACYRLGQFESARAHLMMARDLGVVVPQEQIDAIQRALKE